MANLLSTMEVARLIGCDNSTLRKYCREAKIPFTKVGRSYGIDEKDIPKIKELVEQERPRVWPDNRKKRG